MRAADAKFTRFFLSDPDHLPVHLHINVGKRGARLHFLPKIVDYSLRNAQKRAKTGRGVHAHEEVIT